MSHNVWKAVNILADRLLSARKPILLTPSDRKDTIEITITENAKIFVTINRILITAKANQNNKSISEYRVLLSDDSRIAFDCKVTDTKDIEKAADIICRLQ